VVQKSNWNDIEGLVLQCALTEPRSLPNVLGQLLKYERAGYVLDKTKCQNVFAPIMTRYAPLGQGSEVACSLWGSILFDIPVVGQSITAVSEMDDDVIALLALDARSKGLTPSGLTFPKWSNYMRTDELMGEHWLLSHEANVTEWLPSISVPDHVSRDANFRFLKNHGVFFS